MHNGKRRLSVRLLNAADGKTLYRNIIETDAESQAGSVVANSNEGQIYAILNVPDLSSIELVPTDSGLRDQSTRDLLTAGAAVRERRTLTDIVRAADLFQKAVKAQPTSALALSNLAVAQYGRAFLTGDPQYLTAAETSARKALELDPNSAEAHRAISLVLLRQGRSRESLEEALTARELVEGDSELFSNGVASVLRSMGEPARALSWFRISRSNRPGMNEFAIADCLTDLGDDNGAAAEYRRASTLLPEHPEGWIGLCRLALLQKQFAAAQAISSENWIHYRDYVFSEEMAAQVQFFSRNFAEAEKLYKELVAKDPSGGGSFYGALSYQSVLGWLRLAADDEKNGRPILEGELQKEMLALTTAPEDPEILYRLAAIESSLGHIDSAIRHLDAATKAGWIDYRSLALDPRFDELRKDTRFHNIFEVMVTRVTSLRNQATAMK
jgi:tetratricopeptide (TPR) repeat protein